MNWRERLAPKIAKIIADVGTDDMKRLRKALACPEGYRGYWPGKVWRSEVRYQLGLKTPKEQAAEAEKTEATYQGRTLFDAEGST